MKVEIKFEIELPEIEHTEDELEEFIRFETGDNGMLAADNPFKLNHIEPIFGTLEWEYTNVKLSLIKD